MTNAAELECALIKARLTKKDFAKALGISLQALYNRLNNTAEFKASEILCACKILSLSSKQRDKIFFASVVE